MMIEGGCEGKSVAHARRPAQSPFAAKSSYVGDGLPGHVVSALVDSVGAAGALPGVGGGIVFDGYGGAINRGAPATRPSSTARRGSAPSTR